MKLEFHGYKVTPGAGLLPFRELDDVLGLTEMAGEPLLDSNISPTYGIVGILQLTQINDEDRPG